MLSPRDTQKNFSTECGFSIPQFVNRFSFRAAPRPHEKQVFDNIKAVVEAAGGTLDNIVKLTIYLANIAKSPILNDVMTK